MLKNKWSLLAKIILAFGGGYALTALAALVPLVFAPHSFEAVFLGFNLAIVTAVLLVIFIFAANSLKNIYGVFILLGIIFATLSYGKIMLIL